MGEVAAASLDPESTRCVRVWGATFALCETRVKGRSEEAPKGTPKPRLRLALKATRLTSAMSPLTSRNYPLKRAESLDWDGGDGREAGARD
jgi:hypothetical protein